LDSIRTVISLHALIVMAITATQTVLEQHVNQDLQCSTLKNVRGIVCLIKLGTVQITVAGATVASFGCRQNKDVHFVMRVVESALDHQTKCL
jgi:hypothetical protein